MTGGGNQDGEPGQKISKGKDTGGDLARVSSKATGGDRAPGSCKATGGDRAPDSSKSTGGDLAPDSSKSTGGDRAPDSSKSTGGDDSRASPKVTGGDRAPDSSKSTGGDDSRASPKVTIGDYSRASPKVTIGDDSPVFPKVTVGDDSHVSSKLTVDDYSCLSPKGTVNDHSRVSPKGTADYLVLASPKFTVKGTDDSLQGTTDEEGYDVQYLALSLMHDIDESLHKMELLKRAMLTPECEEESMPLKRSKVEEASITANHLEVLSPRSKRNLEDEGQSEQILKRSKYDSPVVAQSPCESSGLIVALRSIVKRGKDLHLERRDGRLEKRELRLENREAWLENRENRLEKRERLLDLHESQKDQSLEKRKAEFDENWKGYQNWLLYNAPLEDAPSASIQNAAPAAEGSPACATQQAPSSAPKTSAPAPETQTPPSLNRIADAVKTGVTTTTQNLESADKMATLVEKVVAAPTRVQDLMKSYEANKQIVSTLRESYKNKEVASNFKKVIAGVVTSSLFLAREALKNLARGGGDGDE